MVVKRNTLLWAHYWLSFYCCPKDPACGDKLCSNCKRTQNAIMDIEKELFEK